MQTRARKHRMKINKKIMRFNVVYHTKIFYEFHFDFAFRGCCLSFSLFKRTLFRSCEETYWHSIVRSQKVLQNKKKEYHGKSERTREWKATQKKAATTHNYDYFADNNEHFTLIYLAIRSNSVHKRKKITMQKNWRQKGLLHHFHYACNSSRVFLRHKFLPLTYPFLRGTLSRQTPRNSLNI